MGRRTTTAPPASSSHDESDSSSSEPRNMPASLHPGGDGSLGSGRHAAGSSTSSGVRLRRSPLEELVRHQHPRDPFQPTNDSPLASSSLLRLKRIHHPASSTTNKDRIPWWFAAPQRWSLVCLLLLILSVASTSSFLIHLAVYWSTSPTSTGTLDHGSGSSIHFPFLLPSPRNLHTAHLRSVNRLQEATWFTSVALRPNATFPPRVTFLGTVSDWTSTRAAQVWTVRTMTTSDYNHMDHRHFSRNGTTATTLVDGAHANAPSSSSEQVDFSTERADGCQPMAPWQVQSFPNCNAFHETDFQHSLPADALSVLGQGWFRITWKLNDTAALSPPVVLKTLRLERDFLAEYYELHRRDATAMERLTWSEFVVDIFGYCGQSALNEMANFPYGDVRDLEKFNRKLRNRHGVAVDRIKLQLAASVAQGVADIHSIDGGARATMVHYDLNPRNIALFEHGRPKINDFNIAEFLHYHPETNETCGFVNRMHQPWWRAPEEVDENRTVLLNEKADVYSLCNILFATFTTHAPRGKMKDYRMDGVRALVAQGIPPEVPSPYKESTSKTTKAFRAAFGKCFHKDPAERASAQEITDILVQALYELQGKDQSGKTTLSRNASLATPAEEKEVVAAAAVAAGGSSSTDEEDDNAESDRRPSNSTG